MSVCHLVLSLQSLTELSFCLSHRAEEAERLQALRSQLEEDQARLMSAAGMLARREADLE